MKELSTKEIERAAELVEQWARLNDLVDGYSGVMSYRFVRYANPYDIRKARVDIDMNEQSAEVMVLMNNTMTYRHRSIDISDPENFKEMVSDLERRLTEVRKPESSETTPKSSSLNQGSQSQGPISTSDGQSGSQSNPSTEEWNRRMNVLRDLEASKVNQVKCEGHRDPAKQEKKGEDCLVSFFEAARQLVENYEVSIDALLYGTPERDDRYAVVKFNEESDPGKVKLNVIDNWGSVTARVSLDMVDEDAFKFVAKLIKLGGMGPKVEEVKL
jgi:hypothetical protein